MFSNISRFRKLPDDVTIDADGRELESKSSRVLPEVSGKFQHTVEEVDRLDHLAFKFYKQPRNWWRICDANPEVLSPRALLGKEPLVTQRFPVEYNGAETAPPWADVLSQLTEVVGVEDVQVEEEIELVIEQIEGEDVTFNAEQFRRALVITYNRMNIEVAELNALISNTGFEVFESQNIGQVGKQIIIPPPVVG